MKYFLQGIMTVLGIAIPIFIFFYEKGIAITVLKTPIIGVNGVLFMGTFLTFFVLYIMLAIEEKSRRFVCYSYAQWICVYGCVLSILIAGQEITILGYDAIIGKHPEMICFFSKLIIFMLAWGFFLVAQYISISSFGKSLIFGKSVLKPKKHIGEIAIPMAESMGIDPEKLKKLLEKAYRKQQRNLKEEADV